ncbi:MAG: tetratricopeptide repeat protein [Firmicutes bacterium]|nr:tetratricopeptide repeat protein [Bacillota bacterium]
MKNEKEETRQPLSPFQGPVAKKQPRRTSAQVDKKTTGGDDKTDEGRQVALYKNTFAEAVNLHKLGVDGDKEAVTRAYELFEQMHQANPDDQVVKAYYGSATTLLGRDAIDPTERFKYALKGNKILDNAVAGHPENIEIRTLRGYVSYRLPEMYFHRTATAIEDFKYLVERYEQDNSAFSRDFYWQLLFDMGVAYKNIGQQEQAEATWTKLLNAAVHSKYRKLVKQEGMELPVSAAETTDAGDISEARAESDANLWQPQEPLEKEDSPDMEPLQAGMKLYHLALHGDQEATREVFNQYKQAHDKNPHDPLVMAYYADSLSMIGRDSKDNTEMFANPIKAMKMLDKAVNSRPDDISIRLIRANHSYRLPEAFFRRSSTAVADFEYLLERYEWDGNIFPPEIYREILYKLGMSYKRLQMQEEAKSAWLRLMSLNPEEKYQVSINKELHDSQLDDDIDLQLKNMDRSGGSEQLLEEAVRLHDLGVAGNKRAVKRAHDILKQAYEADPEDPVVMGYYGSCIALLGRDSTDPSAMFGNGIRGYVMLKKAVARDWSNPRLRVLRGYLAYNLPQNFFPMTEKAVKDLRFVKSAYEQDSSLFSKEFYWQLLFDLGMAHRRMGEKAKAEKIWSKLIKVTTEPKYKELIEFETNKG